MTIVRFSSTQGPRLGVAVGDELAPLAVEIGPREGIEVLLDAGREEIDRIVREAREGATRLQLDSVELLAPVPRPGKVFAVGLNYADHIAEAGLPTPETPMIFAKYPNTIAGPRDAIQRPRVSRELDYEGELAIVIGTRCRHVPRERAHEVIGGYFVLNDVTVRDWQKATAQWTMGKTFDTHAPTGPWLTLPDEVDVEAGLRLETRVNGELRQTSNTANLVAGARELIAHLSQACTLEPGDIIATGTPGGVGFLMDPPRYLEAGDEVRVSIDGLGELVNRVVDEPEESGHIGAEVLTGGARSVA